jgi:hypothetical protein
MGTNLLHEIDRAAQVSNCGSTAACNAPQRSAGQSPSSEPAGRPQRGSRASLTYCTWCMLHAALVALLLPGGDQPGHGSATAWSCHWQWNSGGPSCCWQATTRQAHFPGR